MGDPHTVSTKHPAGFREIATADAAALLSGFELLDVREPDEFTGPLGHLRGARLAPLGTVPDVAPTLDKGKKWLVVCRSGGRSGRAAAHLASLGFPEVYNLLGGMMAWNDEGRPIER